MSEVKISTKALIQAWTYPSYYFLQALTETIDREEAVKLFKRYITHYYLDHPSPNRDKFVSLEKRLEDRLAGDTTSSEWVMVHSMVEEGKYAFKNENCPTCVEAMVDLPDVELKYLACCYGDYEAFRANSNDHIILTMEHTIMQGDPYCSRVMHDTRIDYDLRHPPKEFWDNFEPGKEEEAMKYYQKKK
ncbi:MAG: L-2-amino-thiazoline-4-carboxylic acid hydrolase [Candidatus Heimdallarchaeota archaeon]|nr:L-2-amino-thiazoline-4-carboxylic acid hydrolase [Candidatus Heimdallarchaeota archaeon]